MAVSLRERISIFQIISCSVFVKEGTKFTFRIKLLGCFPGRPCNPSLLPFFSSSSLARCLHSKGPSLPSLPPPQIVLRHSSAVQMVGANLAFGSVTASMIVAIAAMKNSAVSSLLVKESTGKWRLSCQKIPESRLTCEDQWQDVLSC